MLDIWCAMEMIAQARGLVLAEDGEARNRALASAEAALVVAIQALCAARVERIVTR